MSPAVRQFLTFRIAGEWYALSAASVQRVEVCPELTPVPGAPPTLPGVFASHGQLVPAVEPRRVLHLSGADEGARQFVVIARDGELVGGLLVDWVDEVVPIEPNAIEPPAAASGAYSLGQVPLRHGMGSLLNLAALFAAAAGE